MLSPAHPFLFTPFDAAIGHFRRYTRASLHRAAPATLSLEKLVYLDAAGMLASAGNRLLLRSAMPTERQILTWDRLLVPVSRRDRPDLCRARWEKRPGHLAQASMIRRQNIIAAAIFLAVAALLLALHGQRMVLTNDEGIVLESAQRMAAGGRLYVDFFGYMSPGSYWLQALVFRLLGVALWTGRLIVILDFALQCALVYWLAAQT